MVASQSRGSSRQLPSAQAVRFKGPRSDSARPLHSTGFEETPVEGRSSEVGSEQGRESSEPLHSALENCSEVCRSDSTRDETAQLLRALVGEFSAEIRRDRLSGGSGGGVAPSKRVELRTPRFDGTGMFINF